MGANWTKSRPGPATGRKREAWGVEYGVGPNHERKWLTVAHRGRHNADAVLLAAIAGGATVRDAAEKAGVGERTATRRMADPTFRREVMRLRGEMVNRAMGKLSDAMTAAADCLTALLTGDSEAVRLGAAKTILEETVKLRTAVEVEAQLVELETLIESNHGEPSN